MKYCAGIPALINRATFVLLLGSGLVPFLPLESCAQKSVNLSWDASPDTNAIGYNIYFGVASRTYTNKISVANNTSANISGLVEGATYYFTATAYDLAGDESDFSNEASYNVPRSVVLTSNLQSSSYAGLFYEQTTLRQQSSGAFRLSAAAGGKYSGSLQLSTTRLPFSGQFGFLCAATNYIQRKNTNPLVLNFNLTPSNQVVGTVSDGSWTAILYGEQSSLHPTTNSAPYAGKYTLMIQGVNASPGSLGNGFGTFTLSSKGMVSLAATLADGTKITESAPASVFGNWPLYVPLYSGQGLVISWLAFTNSASADVSGSLSWIKPLNAKSLLYSNGFTIQTPFLGSLYLSGTNSVLNAATADLLAGGALAGAGSNQIVSLNFSRANGKFTGQLRDPGTGKPVAFQGALLQKLNAGYGFVLGTNLSSPITLIP